MTSHINTLLESRLRAIQEKLGENLSIFEEAKVYIGLNDSETKEQKLETGSYVSLLKNICRMYQVPFSFNVVEGGYLHDDGEYVEEKTIVLSFIDVPRETVDEIAKEVCMLFHQESVLVTEGHIHARSVRETLSIGLEGLEVGNPQDNAACAVGRGQIEALLRKGIKGHVGNCPMRAPERKDGNEEHTTYLDDGIGIDADALHGPRPERVCTSKRVGPGLVGGGIGNLAGAVAERIGFIGKLGSGLVGGGCFVEQFDPGHVFLGRRARLERAGTYCRNGLLQPRRWLQAATGGSA